MAIMTILLLQLRKVLKKFEHIFSPETKRMQHMLFEVISLQIAFFKMLLVFPIFIMTLLLFIIGIHWTYAQPFAMIVALMLESHAIFDYFILLYFIKFYRKSCLNGIRKVLRKILCVKIKVYTVQNVLSANNLHK